MTTLFTLTTISVARQEIKKSRFVASAGPIHDESEAKEFIAAYSDQTAGHNCWAWRMGQNYRFNDDGEPGGTAGKPILAAIDGQSLDGVAVVVSRWFGGILLGSGGLIRAYGGSAAICLREAEKTALVETISIAVTCQFSDLAIVQSRIGSFPGATINSQDFTDIGACLNLSVPTEHVGAVEQMVTDLTGGRAIFHWDDKA